MELGPLVLIIVNGMVDVLIINGKVPPGLLNNNIFKTIRVIDKLDKNWEIELEMD